MNQAPNTFGYLLFGGGLNPWTLVGLAIVASLFGMFSHWAKIVFKDKRFDVSFLEYFFIRNFKASCFAAVAMLGGLFAAFAPLDYTQLTAYQVVLQAFAIGYASDSILNSAEIEPPKE